MSDGVNILLIAAAVLLPTVAWIWWCIRPIAFDPHRWNDLSDDRHEWRLWMAFWIVEKKFLLQKTRGEIVTLLGTPSDAPWFQFSEWDIAFDLHACNVLLDSLALVVRFDKDGRASDCRIVGG